MTGKERIKKAFSHQEADRVPMFELNITPRPASRILGREEMDHGTKLKRDLEMLKKGKRDELVMEDIRDRLAVYSRLGYDMVLIRPNYSKNPSIPEEIEENTWLYVDEDGIWSKTKHAAIPDVLFQVDHSILQGGIPAFEKCVESMEKRIEKEGIIVDESMYEALDYALKNEKNMFILGTGSLPCPTLTVWVTVFLESMILAPELVRRYMDAAIKGTLAALRHQLTMGVDGVLGSNDWYGKNGPFMSPKHFKEFIQPYLQMIVDECHSHGVPFIKHLDGNTKQNAKQLWEEIGIDGYHAIEPVAGMDIGELKSEYGEKLTLLGNLDCGHILTFGSKEDIVESVKDIIRKASPGGGHVFSSSNCIHGRVPTENLMAMIDAVKEYGQYPIKI